MMATELDKATEPALERKPAKRTLSTSKKWKKFSAAVHDYVSLITHQLRGAENFFGSCSVTNS